MMHNGNCHVPPLEKTPTKEELANTKKLILRVSGMGCVNRAMRVRNALVSQYGVLTAEVDHRTGMALIRHNPELVSPKTLLTGIAAAGNDGRHRYQASIV